MILVSAVAAYVRRRINYHRTIAELSAMDERQLKDIGITRGQIEEVARMVNSELEPQELGRPTKRLSHPALAPN